MNKSIIKERDKHRLNCLKTSSSSTTTATKEKKTIGTPAILSFEGFQIDDQTISAQATHRSLFNVRRQREPSLVVN